MAEFTVVRKPAVQLTEAEKETVRKFMFGYVDGLGEKGQRQWKRWVNDLIGMEPGEMLELVSKKPRSGPFHRRHMKIEQAVFEHQERFEDFKRGFRDWLKVGAGHCTWIPGPKGAVMPIPSSTSYAELEEHEMREFHIAAIEFLRKPYALKVLWPHLNEAGRVEMMETILREFGE